MNTPSEQPESTPAPLPALPVADSAPSVPAASTSQQSAVINHALTTLSPLMRQAFLLTTQGLSPTAIIDEVGISRATLYRWKKYNPGFRAAVSAWHQDQVQSTQLGMVAILPEAVDTLRREIKHDARLALKVVDKCGGFAPAPAGCVSPNQVRQEIKLEIRRQKLRARKRQEKVRIQEVNQRAQQLEDKLEATRIDNMRKMDPQALLRTRDHEARLDELLQQQREGRKWDPNYKLDDNYMRAYLYPEEFKNEKSEPAQG